MGVTCQVLLKTHVKIWQQAIDHPFLRQCQQGAIQSVQFDTWLVQDYLFVQEFTRMLARVLGAAPFHHFTVLLDGLAALKEELAWFELKAAERNLELAVPQQATCQQYSEFMASLCTTPYPVQATALWAIEYAYNQGWQLPGAMPVPYAEFAERWGNTGFSEYVNQLAQQADEVLGEASAMTQRQAEAAFLRVATLERDFWQMAFSAG